MFPTRVRESDSSGSDDVSDDYIRQCYREHALGLWKLCFYLLGLKDSPDLFLCRCRCGAGGDRAPFTCRVV